LLNYRSIGFHDLELHDTALRALASEVVRIDVHAPISALHDPGDELLGVQGVVLPREDFPHGPQVALGKPSHAFWVDVKFTEPLDTRKSAPQGIKDLVRVIFVARIVCRLVGGAPSRTHHSQHHVGRH
jgi:hypothetical protein